MMMTKETVDDDHEVDLILSQAWSYSFFFFYLSGEAWISILTICLYYVLKVGGFGDHPWKLQYCNSLLGLQPKWTSAKPLSIGCPDCSQLSENPVWVSPSSQKREKCYHWYFFFFFLLKKWGKGGYKGGEYQWYLISWLFFQFNKE